MSGSYIQFFFTESANTILKAFDFTKSKIKEFYDKQIDATDSRYHSVIQGEMNKEIGEIDRITKFVSENVEKIVFLDKMELGHLHSVIRSACDIYAKDLQEMKKRTGISAFDTAIAEVNQVLSLSGIKKAQTGKYDKYYPQMTTESVKAEFFISYSTKDKELAGKVARTVTQEGAEAFLAHDTIEVSEVWRAEIMKHLISCSAMICVITNNFRESEWTPQEAGFVLGRQRPKIISLILDGVKPPGFLEAIQGITTTREDLETSTKEAISRLVEVPSRELKLSEYPKDSLDEARFAEHVTLVKWTYLSISHIQAAQYVQYVQKDSGQTSSFCMSSR